MTALGALRLQLAASAAAIEPASSGPAHLEPGLALAELEALREVDFVAGAELISAEAPALRSAGGADHLRLPPPPVRASEGYALFAAMGRTVERFEAHRAAPSAAGPDALIAEARMMALVRGLHGLEQEIRTQIARNQKA